MLLYSALYMKMNNAVYNNGKTVAIGEKMSDHLVLFKKLEMKMDILLPFS